MNGFADHGLDQAAFGEKEGFTSNLRTFDAFRRFSSRFATSTPSVHYQVTNSFERYATSITRGASTCKRSTTND